MVRRRPSATVLALALVGGPTACAGGPEDVALPDGVVVHIDQSRVLKKTRTVFLRVENDSRQDLRITGFVLSSPRFDDVEWTGDDEVGPTYETDLEFEMPRGRCGDGIDATATLTYVVDGQERRSTARPDDPYGAATSFLDRDCAELTLDEAADVTLSEATVTGTGGDTVLHLPVTLEPTGRRDDVVLNGFGSTVLFDQADGSAVDVDRSVTGAPVTLDVRLRPNRCDSHALAEDKVGTLIPVEVSADGLPDGSSFYLPLGKERRAALYSYYDQNCRDTPGVRYP